MPSRRRLSPRRGAAALAPLLVFGLVLGSSSRAQEGSGSVFVDRVDVRVVNVEVFVTGPDGAPVTGLEREDFVVLEDGRPVEITNFYAVAGSRISGEKMEGAPAPEAAEPPAAPAEAAPAGDAQQQLSLLLYVDNLNVRPSNRDAVLDELEGFLEDQARDGARVMLVTYDRGVDVVEPFTSDAGSVLLGLEAIRDSPARGQMEVVRLNTAARQIAHALSDPFTADQAPGYYERYVAETRNHLQQSLKALGSVVRAFAGLEGRKAMIYVSDGLPLNPGAELAERFFGGQDVTDDERILFDAVVREANAHGVTFYAIDARGKSGGSITAERGDELGGGTGRAAADAVADFNKQQPLLDMAAPTGGTALLNTANFEQAVDQLEADFASFYSLGFQPTSPGDGEQHRIEVQVKRPGVTVRHRSGFLDKNETERMADQVLATLLVGSVDNPMEVSLELAEAEKQKRKLYLLPILVRVPIRQITLLPNGDVYEGKLRFYLAVQDDEGAVSDVYDFPYPLSIPSEQVKAALGTDLGYQTQLQTRPGSQRIAIGVLDENTGVSSFTEASVVVGE